MKIVSRSSAYYSGRKAPSLKMQMFFFCRRPVELSDWVAPLINMTLFACGDHVWTKYSGQMSEERNFDD